MLELFVGLQGGLKDVMDDRMPKPGRLDHGLFIAVTVLYWVSLYIYVPVLSPYLETLGASYRFIGLVVGSYGLMQILSRLPIGIYSDRSGLRKPFILLGMLTAALSCLMFAAFEPVGVTLVARAVSGLSAACWVAFTVMYAGFFRKEDATRAMSTISLLIVLGELIGMALSGWLVESYGWKSVFWTGSVIGLLGLLLAFGLKEPKITDRQPIRYEDLGQVIKNPQLWIVSVLSILAHSILFITMFGFTPSYAVELGASGMDLTWLSFAFMIPHAVSSYFTGRRIAPRIGITPTLLAGYLVSGLCTLAIPFTRSLGMLMATQAVNGFAQGLHIPLLLGLSIQTVDQNKRATAMGTYQAVYAIGMFAGPILAGYANAGFGLEIGFYLGALIAALSCIVVAVWHLGTAKQNRPAG